MRHNKRTRLERGIGFGNKSGEIGLIVAQREMPNHSRFGQVRRRSLKRVPFHVKRALLLEAAQVASCVAGEQYCFGGRYHVEDAGERIARDGDRGTAGIVYGVRARRDYIRREPVEPAGITGELHIACSIGGCKADDVQRGRRTDDRPRDRAAEIVSFERRVREGRAGLRLDKTRTDGDIGAENERLGVAHQVEDCFGRAARRNGGAGGGGIDCIGCGVGRGLGGGGTDLIETGGHVSISGAGEQA
jgi:hypothetical protein